VNEVERAMREVERLIRAGVIRQDGDGSYCYTDCSGRKALWELSEAERQVKWERREKKRQEQEEANDRLLGKDWRPRMKRRM
jgi:hypothetical protein